MGGFELAQPVETFTNDFLKSQFYKTTRCARFSPPEEMVRSLFTSSSRLTGLETDWTGKRRLRLWETPRLRPLPPATGGDHRWFVLAVSFPNPLSSEELSRSLREISEKMTNVETLEDLSCLTESYAFSNELTTITNFLNRIQIKSQEEKEIFYK